MSLPTLYVGMRGGPVEAVQRLIESFHAQLGVSPGVADGIFGANTLAAVKALQRTGKIAADGVVGPTTWKLLEYAASPGMWAATATLRAGRLTTPAKAPVDDSPDTRLEEPKAAGGWSLGWLGGIAATVFGAWWFTRKD